MTLAWVLGDDLNSDVWWSFIIILQLHFVTAIQRRLYSLVFSFTFSLVTYLTFSKSCNFTFDSFVLLDKSKVVLLVLNSIDYYHAYYYTTESNSVLTVTFLVLAG